MKGSILTKRILGEKYGAPTDGSICTAILSENGFAWKEETCCFTDTNILERLRMLKTRFKRGSIISYGKEWRRMP
jgi:hypothetical protein